MRQVEAQQIALALTLAVERCDEEAFNALWNVDRSAQEWKLIAGQAIRLLWELELDRVGALRCIRHHLENPSDINPTPEELEKVRPIVEALIGGPYPIFESFAEWFEAGMYGEERPGEILQGRLENLTEYFVELPDDDVASVEEVVGWGPNDDDAYQ